MKLSSVLCRPVAAVRTLVSRAKPVAGDTNSGTRAQTVKPRRHGEVTQPSTIYRVQEVQLVIGLDFGTTYTKVVVGEERAKYAVDFGDLAERDCNGYLLPSVFSEIGEGGECVLGRKQRGSVYEHLKMKLIEGRLGDETQVRITAFMALVIRYAKDWLLREHGEVYEGLDINWLVNSGVPTESYDENELKTFYRKAVAAAYAADIGGQTITLSRCRNCLDSDFDHKGVANVVPEFVAQIQGYVRSPRRREYLHTVIDVGGGTVDLTVFNVLAGYEGEWRYPIFYRAVRSLGVERWRHGWLDGKAFRHRMICVIGGGLKYVRERKDPQSPSWKSGVPTFLTGGGAAVELYEDAVAYFERSDCPWQLRRTDLPIPDDINPRRLSERCYGRLAVAYGLSLDPDDFGEIVSQNNTEDVLPPRPVDYIDRFVDKDQV